MRKDSPVKLFDDLPAEVLATVCGGLSETACRAIGFTAGAAIGAPLGFVGVGGLTNAAVNGGRVAKVAAGAGKLYIRGGRLGNGVNAVTDALDGDIKGYALAAADTAAVAASFFPGPAGAAGTGWAMGRGGADAAAAICGYSS